MMRLMRSCVLLAAAVLTSTCGYALSGRGNSLPEYIRVIGIPQFVNQSNTLDLDRVLTDAVRVEFQGRGRYRIVPETAAVDAVLTATIRSLTLVPSAFNENRQATRYLVTIVASVEFRETKDNKVFWSNPNLRVSDEYEVTSAVAPTDPSKLFTQDTNALDRMARMFARSLVAAILEAF
jgi:outer membrane lipopolysaccharide assembly protein LptE/RlpB